MIGCDVSGHSVEHLAFNGIHGEVALFGGSTAMLVFMNRRYVEVTEDEDAESEECPCYCLDLDDLRATVLAFLRGRVPIRVAKCLIFEQISLRPEGCG